jgi:hypothetical protein
MRRVEGFPGSGAKSINLLTQQTTIKREAEEPIKWWEQTTALISRKNYKHTKPVSLSLSIQQAKPTIIATSSTMNEVTRSKQTEV